MKVNVGVIGLGFMGSAHARVYKNLRNCTLVAVCDTNNSKKRIANEYKCNFYDNINEFLNEELDAISVCTPTSIHKQIVLAALEQKKHVLVEKPFAENIIDAKEMNNKALKQDCILTIGYIERFNSAVKTLKKIINPNQVFSTVSIRFGPFPPRTKYSGVFLDLASHEIDILNYITQVEPTVLYSHFSTKSKNIFEDYAYVSLKYGHIHSHIETSWLPDYKLRLLNLYCDKEYYILDYAQQKLISYNAPPKAIIEKGNWNDILWLTRHIKKEIPILANEPLVLELQCFIDSIIKTKIIPPLCPPEEAMKVLKVIESALKIGKG